MTSETLDSALVLRHTDGTGELPDVHRRGEALGVPGDTTPASRGDPFLDFAYGSAHEHEAARWRDAAVARRSREVLTASPLMRIAAVVAVLRIVAVAAFVGAFVLAPVLPGRAVLFMPLLLLVAVLLLLIAFGAARQFLFTLGVSWALHRMNNQSPGLGTIVGQTLRAGRRLAHLGLGRLSAPMRSLFDAVTAFVVPVMLAEGLDYRQARARSEDLVASRWGPGRFRGHGMPRMAYGNVRYVELTEKHGRNGPYRQLWFMPAALLVGLVVAAALRSSDAGVLAGIGVLLAWIFVLALRSTTTQPVMEGVLRAYLYDYARTGRALPPYEAALLHDCMREELRGIVGLAQRGPADAAPSAPSAPPPLTPVGYVRDAGVTGTHATAVLGSMPDLVRDTRAVLKATRDAIATGERADAGAIAARTGLSAERTAVMLAHLVETRYLLASMALDGTATYEPRKKKASWWERR